MMYQLKVYWLILVEWLWLHCTWQGWAVQAERQHIESAEAEFAARLQWETDKALSAQSIAEARARLDKYRHSKSTEHRNLTGKVPAIDLSVVQGKEIHIEIPMSALESPVHAG